MFELFKGEAKQATGAELAAEGLRRIAIAIENNLIELQQGRVYNDVYAHMDQPNGNPRLSYVMFSPTI